MLQKYCNIVKKIKNSVIKNNKKIPLAVITVFVKISTITRFVKKDKQAKILSLFLICTMTYENILFKRKKLFSNFVVKKSFFNICY